MGNLKDNIADLLNKHSRENESNTPDFILATFLMDLHAFEQCSNAREDWYGKKLRIPDGKIMKLH